MAISVLDLFKIGVGPSSSHTVGPMKAARRFAEALEGAGLLGDTASIRTELFGALAATGRGHGTDRAVVLGLLGETPEGVDVDAAPRQVDRVRATGRLAVLGRHEIAWREAEDLRFVARALARHANGLRLAARDAGGRELLARTYFSVGGGFVVEESEPPAPPPAAAPAQRWPFDSGAQLLARCAESGLPVAGVVLENERAWHTPAELRAALLGIWEVMQACVARGCRAEGTLPGGLHVRRRAPDLHRLLRSRDTPGDPLVALDWVNLWALATNEENAAGGRVVTAPTNGAAGVIPAVLHYYRRFVAGADDDGVVRFLLAAGAVGMLFKQNASISGAEVGCQGEVGSACSMAAAGLVEALGGTPAQVENAAEIAMEHLLGLTCDPVAGLVQVPCIERNAMAAVQAITAARLALQRDGQHFVSLDKVIRTMRDTGADMKTEYKETARAGLAVNAAEAPPGYGVNVPEC